MKRNRRFWIVLIGLLVGVGVIYVAVSWFGDGDDPVKPPLPTVRVG